jgi:hypothetical protein
LRTSGNSSFQNPIAAQQLGGIPYFPAAILIDKTYRFLYRQFMKTTLDIDDYLLANAKALAARQRTSLTRLIEEGLQLRLRSSRSASKVGKRKIPVYKGRGGIVPGLDPCSNKAMLDAADNDA